MPFARSSPCLILQTIAKELLRVKQDKLKYHSLFPMMSIQKKLNLLYVR